MRKSSILDDASASPIVLVVVLIVGETAENEDDDEDEDDLGKESRRATVCIEAINQAGQHCYDTGKHFFPGANAIDRDEAFGDRRIKPGEAALHNPGEARDL